VKSSVSEIPVVDISGTRESIFESGQRSGLEPALPVFLRQRRWFAGKARDLEAVEIADAISVPGTSPSIYITLVRVVYSEGDPDLYMLPLSFIDTPAAERIITEWPATVVARTTWNQDGILYEPLARQDFAHAIPKAVAESAEFRGKQGKIVASHTSAFSDLRGTGGAFLQPRVMGVEQSNTSIVLGEKLMLKLFRHLQEGINPDVEIGIFLTQRTQFRHFPTVSGTLTYEHPERPPSSIAVLQQFVPNEGDAWQFTLDAIRDYFDRVAARQTGVHGESEAWDPAEKSNAAVGTGVASMLLEGARSRMAEELMGDYFDAARLLGQRTAELHIALGSVSDDPSFSPEPFTHEYQGAMCESMHKLTNRVFRLLRSSKLPQVPSEQVQKLFDLEPEILGRFERLLRREVAASRIRTHGDYHLGQVLRTERDFVIIDFEGEPDRSIQERQKKFSPLRDVSGMLRSFHYAAYFSFISRSVGSNAGPERIAGVETWAQRWYGWASSEFLSSYLQVADGAAFVPQSREELQLLLEAFLLEKAIYELGYELNNRPDWVRVPLTGILQILEPRN
jgi:maltose alpha-D-glucosyltransferase/alpha-amylase